MNNDILLLIMAVASIKKVDKIFLLISVVLIVGGFFIFHSASLALLAKETSNYSNVAFSQTFFGLFLGTLAMLFFSRMDFQIWKKVAMWLLLAAIILNIIVLVPGIGFEHAGAKRWIRIAGISFQTSEFLKLAFVLYFAAWVSGVKDKVKTFYWGFLPLVILFAISSALLLRQPDTDNLLVIILAGMAMFIVTGAKWRHILLIVLAGAIGFAFLVATRPYLAQRVATFLDPQADALGASYQVRQSLIAVGSGGLFGRGYGQGIQKFTYLPEPVGDSVFAVAAEEFGFVGSVFLIFMFVLFATRGLKIASNTSNTFARLTVVGIVIMITSQAFINIGAMLGVLPLSGITLPFVSLGGTSLFFTLVEVGIILSISRHKA